MIAWINFVVLAASTLLTYLLYVLSVQPAALERRIGPAAYPRCTRCRVLAGVFMIIACADYVIYYFYPLPIPLPRTFPGPYRVWVLAAAVIALPSGYLFWRGIRDAGEETMRPRKEHTLYGGIYEKIRHPQMAGELPFFWVFAFLLNSPFLALYSFVWVPVFLAFCWAEEKDLVLRYGAVYEEYRRHTGSFFPKGK